MTDSSETQQATFQNDRPITTATDDRLDVDVFIRRLVGPIMRSQDGGSLVVGLYGPWGSGKSSALHLLESSIEEVNELEGPAASGMPYALVVRFTPWLYGSVETLLPAFFDTLAAAVGGLTVAPKKRRNKIEGALRGMAEFVVPAATLGGHLLGGPFGGQLVESIAKLVQGTSKGAAEVMAATKPDFDEGRFREQRETAARMLQELKAGLRPVRVVMTIDDLDRSAGADEVLAMLKLVKLVGDLPNVTYVIAMDRAHIEDLLETKSSTRFGREFLDKIVQVGITLPAVDPRLLTRWLIDEATVVASSANMDPSSLAVDWDDTIASYLPSNSFEQTLQLAIRSPRDVARILNAYRFAALSGDDQAPLHALDLLLISTLQVTAPRTYDAVRLNGRFLLHQDRTVFDDMSGNGRNRGATRARRQARLESISRGEIRPTNADSTAAAQPPTTLTGSASERHGVVDEAALALVTRLFPHAVMLHSDGADIRTAVRSERAARDEYRIFSPDRFNGYFRFALPPATAPVRLVRQAFAILCGRDPEGDATPITAPPDWVREFANLCALHNVETRESLLQQLGDRMASLSRDEARSLAIRVPVLVRYADTDFSEVAAMWAEQIVETLTTYRAGGRGDPLTEAHVDDDKRLAAAHLLNLLDAFGSRSATFAIMYADRVSKDDGYPMTCPSPESRSEITRRGLRYARTILKSTDDIFSGSMGFDGSSLVWIYHKLAERAGARTVDGRDATLQEYLQQLVVRVPARLGHVISCAATWRDVTPHLRDRSLADVRGTLSKFVDPEWLEKTVRRASMLLQDGRVSDAFHPTEMDFPELVRDYIMLVRRADAESAPTVAPSEQTATRSERAQTARNAKGAPRSRR
jgi:hypothetical protein